MMLYPAMKDLLKQVPSRYQLVNVVAHRAREIAADADEQNQREGQVHDRKRDRKAGNGQRTDAMPDKNTVDDVVKGKDHHRGDGGQGIPEKQFSDRFFS